MITSKSNALIKRIRSLSDKKFRDEFGLFVVEGVKSVNEAINSSLEVSVIVGTEKGLSAISSGGEKIEQVSEEVFLSISGEKSPQGVLAVVNKPKAISPFSGNRAILLDGVSDPANVGAIIRTAAAVGITGVFAVGSCADPFSPKSVRASMGGIFKINYRETEYSKISEEIGLPLIVADMGGENIFNFSVPEKFCLVIGNEGKGVSQTLKSNADYTVSIPMENGVESLNAAVSAGILMYLLKNS